MKNSDFDNKYYRAKERVEQIKKFYTSLTSYVVVISFLAALNYYNNEWRYAWFLWAAFGWGIGLVFHAIKVFGLNPFFGKDWEERKIKEFMNDDENENRWN
ncbi:MAG: 2TM domain-containing protein [Maribacter sp.]|nr:2TM domain-containing protein [Maribacter sp.]